MVRAGAAAGDDLGRQAGGPQGVQEAREPCPALAQPFQPLGQRGDVLQLAVVGLHPAIVQAGLGRDAPRHADGRVDVRDAGAGLTHVDVDQDAERPIGAGQRRQRVHSGFAVGHDGEVAHALARRHQPRDHRRRHDGRGDEDAVEARRGHDLGLAHGGAAQADRAGRELAAGDLRRLVRLDVGPQLAAGAWPRRPPWSAGSPRTHPGRGAARGSTAPARSRQPRSGLRSGLGSWAGPPWSRRSAGADRDRAGQAGAGREHGHGVAWYVERRAIEAVIGIGHRLDADKRIVPGAVDLELAEGRVRLDPRDEAVRARSASRPRPSPRSSGRGRAGRHRGRR